MGSTGSSGGFASVLKDKAGRLSGYRYCDGEVCFMPEQQSYENIFCRVKIDINTMEVLSHDSLKDQHRVYRRGVLLRGSSPEGFRVFNGVYIGNHQVVYIPYGDAKIASPETFEVLDDSGIPEGDVFPASYGRDQAFVYHFTGSTDTRHAVRLRACHTPASFHVLSWGYAKDDAHVYCCGLTVKGAKPDGFEVLTNSYARDKRHVFLGNRLIGADAKTFVVLENGDGQDCQHTYRHGEEFIDENN